MEATAPPRQRQRQRRAPHQKAVCHGFTAHLGNLGHSVKKRGALAGAPYQTRSASCAPYRAPHHTHKRQGACGGDHDNARCRCPQRAHRLSTSTPTARRCATPLGATVTTGAVIAAPSHTSGRRPRRPRRRRRVTQRGATVCDARPLRRRRRRQSAHSDARLPS